MVRVLDEPWVYDTWDHEELPSGRAIPSVFEMDEFLAASRTETIRAVVVERIGTGRIAGFRYMRPVDVPHKEPVFVPLTPRPVSPRVPAEAWARFERTVQRQESALHLCPPSPVPESVRVSAGPQFYDAAAAIAARKAAMQLERIRRAPWDL